MNKLHLLGTLLAVSPLLTAQTSRALQLSRGVSDCRLVNTASAMAQGAFANARVRGTATLFGSTRSAYSVSVVRAPVGTIRLDTYSVNLGGNTVAFGFLPASGRFLVPRRVANVYPSEVSKTYWFTTGSFRVFGNLQAESLINVQMGSVIDGSVDSGVRGTLRLNLFGGNIDSEINFGRSGFFGPIQVVWPGRRGLRYRQGTSRVRLRLAPFTLFGTPNWRTAFQRTDGTVIVDPFLTF